MKTKILTPLILLTWMISTQSCEIDLKKKEGLWATHPCGFTSDEEFRTFRESRSFKIIDAVKFNNVVDTVGGRIHPDSVRLFDSEMNDIILQIGSPKFSRLEWEFGFFPYEGIPLNNADTLLSLEERIFYLSTSYNDIDTLTIEFEKCRLKEAFFNNQTTIRPVNDKSEGGVTFYFKKTFLTK